MASRSEAARYRFGPLEKRGFIAGWRGGQVGIVALGLLVAVGVLRVGHPPLDLVEALACVLGSIAAASWPIAARTCDQWCPVVTLWLVRLLGGEHHHVSTIPTLGRPAAVPVRKGHPVRNGHPDIAPGALGHRPRARHPQSRPGPSGRATLPAPLSGCRLLAPPTCAGGLRLGVIHDPKTRTYTGVMAVSGAAFALLEQEERNRRVAAWSSLLASLARDTSPVHRLQWVQRDLPGDPSELTRRMASQTVLSPEAPAARSYAEVVQRAGRLARSHQVLLALSIRADRSTREIRAFGGGDEGACGLLARELRALATALVGAEVLVQGVLSPKMLAMTLRQAFDAWPIGSPGTAPGASGHEGTGHDARHAPGASGHEGTGHDAPDAPDAPHAPGASGHEQADQAGAGRLRAGPPGRVPLAGSNQGWPWPLASQTSWTAHRTEETWHATYWVAEWPRVDVGPDFLAPLLLHSGVRHTMAVTMEPISPLKAARDVTQARTADLADAEIRRRGGFLTSARRGREAEAVTQREMELADGHAEYRFSGYVTVTARSAQALDTDCLRIEQAAGQARLELRRLYGQQDEAFTWTLPMGRGLA